MMTPEEIWSSRKEMGLSREEFGNRLGVSGSTVYRWEKGLGKPSKLAIKMIKSVLESYLERKEIFTKRYAVEPKILDLKIDRDAWEDEIAEIYKKAYAAWLGSGKSEKERPEIPKGLGRVKAQILRFQVRSQFRS